MDILLQKLADVQYQFLCDNGDYCKGPSEYCSSVFKECRPCSVEICQRRGGEGFPLQCNISCIIEDALELASRTTHFTNALTVAATDLIETSTSADAVTVKDLTGASTSDACVWVWPFIAMTFVTIILLLVLIKVFLAKRCEQLRKKKWTYNNSNGNAQWRGGNDEESELDLLPTGITQPDVISETPVKKVVTTSMYNGDAVRSEGTSQEVRPVVNSTYESKSDLNSNIFAKAPTLNMSTFENDRTTVRVL